VRSRGVLLAAALLLGTAAGCAAPLAAPEAAPSEQALPAACPETPRAPGPAEDDGSDRELVPTSPEPVQATLCVYGIRPASSPGADPQAGPPVAVAQDGAALAGTVEELNGMPPFTDAEDHACDAALWPGYLLLVRHRDDTVTTLTLDRSCGLVADGAGAVRLGLPSIVTDG
jgi:hypothetical protein